MLVVREGAFSEAVRFRISGETQSFLSCSKTLRSRSVICKQLISYFASTLCSYRVQFFVPAFSLAARVYQRSGRHTTPHHYGYSLPARENDGRNMVLHPHLFQHAAHTPGRKSAGTASSARNPAMAYFSWRSNSFRFFVQQASVAGL